MTDSPDVSVSCTVAFLGLDKTEFARFNELEVQPALLLSRGHGEDTPRSIHISTLLASIGTLLNLDFEQWINLQASRNLFYALCHQGSQTLAELDGDWIQVSTLQAPVFDDDRHHNSYNYRRLGPLSSIKSCPTPLDPNHFNHAREVLAINPLLSESTPEVMALAHSFSYMGLYLETHFIVVFELVSSMSIFPPRPVISGLGEGGTQPTDMATDQLAICCWDDEWQLTTLSPFPLAPTSFQKNGGQLESHSPTSSTRNQDFEHISARLTPGKSLADVFTAFGLDLEAERIRLQLSSSRSLQELFDNHNAGSQILEKLGLAGFRIDPNAKQIYKHTGGLELDATAVLSQGFTWSVFTYSKKSRAFIWAENVHNFQWKDSEPKGMFFTCDALLSLIFIFSLLVDDKNYQLWRGIIAYFKPNGFLAKHHIPSRSLPDYDERCATYVTQNILLNSRTTIAQFLILITEDQTA